MYILRHFSRYMKNVHNFKRSKIRNTFHLPCNYINTEIIPTEVKVNDKKHFLKEKFNELVAWYEEFTGLDEVKIMQNRVLEAQDKFVVAQDKRREMSKELARIQNRLKEIYSELETTSRGEERYLHLVTQEHKILKEERRLTAEFALIEREERDAFATLSASVKDSHEKERAQAERTKYWSVIGSIIGTVIGVAGSSINNEFKMKELRKLVKESTIRNMENADVTAAKILADHEQELTSIVSEMKSTMNSYLEEKENINVIGKIDKLLHTMGSKTVEAPREIEESLKILVGRLEELKTVINSSERHSNEPSASKRQDLESLIHRQYQETRLILTGIAVIGIVVPFLISFIQR